MQNTSKDQDDFCRYLYTRIGPGYDASIERETNKSSPNGALTTPYSRGIWDKYWNNRIYHVWNVGPDSCNGAYMGPSGRDMIRAAIIQRRMVGLPEINLEARNRDKEL